MVEPPLAYLDMLRPRSMESERATMGSSLEDARAVILDPTHELNSVDARPTVRVGLGGIGPVGLMDINKGLGDVFLDRIEATIRKGHPAVVVNRYRKESSSKPASEALLERIVRDGNKQMICAVAD